jgi:hypothetical protein
MNARVSSQDHIGLEVVAQLREELRAGCRFPQELIRSPWAAVTKQQTQPVYLKPQLRGQSPHPGTMFVAGVI